MSSAYNDTTLAPTPDKCFNSSLKEWNATANYIVGNGTAVNCTALFEDFLDTSRLVFDAMHVVRISVAWSAFVVSLLGNLMVLLSVTVWRRNNNMTHTQTLMLNIALANLCFTAFVMPTDAIWQTTMQWFGGDFLCRLVQWFKQFSMYVSSFMVATMEIDRAIGLLRPVSPGQLKRRLRLMLTITWSFCLLGAIPASVVFKCIVHEPAPCACPNMSVTQCVDFMILSKHQMNIYHFYTFLMPFILPVLVILVCFGIIAFRITELAKKARETELRSAGFRNVQNGASPQRKSLVRKSLERAKRLSQLVTVFITLTFLLCWGPYYLIAIYHWFDGGAMGEVATQWMLMTLYLNPCVHPLIIILLLKDVRRNLDCNLPLRFRFAYLTGNNKCSGSTSRSNSHGSPRNVRVALNDIKAGHSRTTHV